jgi:hypothetical protein
VARSSSGVRPGLGRHVASYVASYVGGHITSYVASCVTGCATAYITSHSSSRSQICDPNTHSDQLSFWHLLHTVQPCPARERQLLVGRQQRVARVGVDQRGALRRPDELQEVGHACRPRRLGDCRHAKQGGRQRDRPELELD